ncbi:MAG: FAD-dependent monooxygenase [Bacteroidia bacterium]|nr:FAD-dependent monooxygenase [Bacteroidia bacterium]
MISDNKYDVAIAGGGLAGLALSIQLARQGHTVIVFEKEQYPFHKVCGEYISMESWDFLKSLGVDLNALHVSIITKLLVSSLNGKLLAQPLPLGGFGISRYRLDNTLVEIARTAGVIIKENTKVDDVVFTQSGFIIAVSKQRYHAALVCGCFGKRSNLDIKQKRPFVMAKQNKLNNYVGVKYHLKIDFPADTIALHNFSNGYCGLVKIEDDKYNLCYLTTAENLKKNKGSIPDMERTILSQNPHLKKIFTEKEILFEAPVTISQISFDKKNQVEDHMLMIGDAAGMITALCGNGMSMALHGSKLAAEQISLFLHGHITREVMEKIYMQQWQQQFGKRLKAGRRIQRLFGSNKLTNFFIALARPFPQLVRYLIQQTHGKPF